MPRTRKLLEKNSVELAPNGFDSDPIQEVARKRVDQHVSRLFRIKPARAQVEQRVGIELADRRAVGTLDIVSEDLELRFRVDLCVLREQQRFVRLLRVGLLRVNRHDDLAVEHRAGAVIEDALVQLVAVAVRLRVEDGRVVVDETSAVDQIEPVERALGAFRPPTRQ